MRELRSCDFCDAEAVGAFEIVPPALEPTEAEQRRVVPCADCKDRLETLLEPLLARAGAESGAGTETDPADPDSTADDDRTDGSRSVVATADESTEKRPRSTSPNATVSGSPAESDDSNPSQPAGEADSDPDSGSTAEAGLEDGITFERDEGTVDSAGSAADDSDDPADGASNGETETGDTSNAAAPSDTDDNADDADRSTPDAEPTGSSSRPPTAYNKVIRLLRNREFPMKRTAVEELAAGAYDLESHEVEAIIDYAVEDGEFVEKRGMLRRT
ncbi:hypothetical protein [Natrinema versiforme]|uniref:Uncharacterized protein n=1 Tax=Natrinema versiforme JCM 10478 TaxID=1227496 RepID=L9XVP2_9EURY|nr:hypothetical protein [Natrinema versiforme]ELY65486.1 hypothetical protein C489_14450 [Natrinema versiforme JCM 10478]